MGDTDAATFINIHVLTSANTYHSHIHTSTSFSFATHTRIKPVVTSDTTIFATEATVVTWTFDPSDLYLGKTYGINTKLKVGPNVVAGDYLYVSLGK